MSEKKYIDLGQVTAYAYAKEHGYTGTEEEFGEEQAQFAQNAQQVAEDRVVVREDRVIVREDREHVDEVAEAFTGTTAPEAVQRVTTEGNTQVARVQDEGDTQVDRVQDEGDTQVTAVRGEGSTQVSRVQGEGSAQVTEVHDEGDTQVARVQNEGNSKVSLIQTEGATQVQAVEDKGEEILESIPENYEEKIDEVNDYLTNVIKVSDVQPQSEVNKLWIKDQVGQEYTVPTYEEFEALSNDVSNAKNAIDQLEGVINYNGIGNSFDGNYYNGYWNATGNIVDSQPFDVCCATKIPCPENANVVLITETDVTGYTIYISYFDEAGTTRLRRDTSSSAKYEGVSPAGTYYLAFTYEKTGITKDNFGTSEVYINNRIDILSDKVVTDVTVTGTDVTIVAQANKRYLCGTVSTIAVTPCATGAFDLIFTSGSSAAILTIPSTVKWQDSSFDPTALDTDTIYEISVADGTLGLVASWT